MGRGDEVSPVQRSYSTKNVITSYAIVFFVIGSIFALVFNGQSFEYLLYFTYW